MKSFVYFILIAVITSGYGEKCTAQQAGADGNKKVKLSIINKVKSLRETKLFFKDASAAKPLIITDDEPNPTFNNYWGVQVGISNMDMFRTSFHFYVDPKTLNVYYLDTFTDSGLQLLTLPQWRQWRKKAAWKNLHYYKYSGDKLIFLDKK
ncbi:hypothetical protein GWR56_20335 [Mucilaginibacter sp. 14171R-50]|uniref:hypothetical protein n=1 Tax=Mucilaginibacter sp. 14171R-50 TaxID=2703789 RepID=UPI00138CC9B7|nr:hypothetical protein [Mucilaginibacter sp. 14171R-50]QHS57780.1 hypothetical protein GWR56_20335 [Mucilaginibacter sp. 14171R-50]